MQCQLCGRESRETHRIRNRKIVCQVCTGERKPGPAEADARALWAYRVQERLLLKSGGYSLESLDVHESRLYEKAEALVAEHPELDPDAPRPLKSP